MAIQVQLLDDAGAPMTVGFAVELVREGEVLATANIGAEGRVVFDVDATGPLAVRFAKTDDVVRWR